ncbi:NmrA family transcriptional regulator, partial [Micromonospora purpureochromogenes]
MTEHLTALVLGGTGKTGRRVARRLTTLGVPTRIGSRAGTPPFDWTDRDTWVPALRGVGAVYLAYQPDLAAPGAVATVGDL